MHTRRYALKMMTVGLGACVLPSIGFSGQQIPNQTPRKVMGVDQMSGRLSCLLQLNGDHPERIQTDFEHLPTVMQEYEIEHCVIDSQPLTLEAIKFAKTFPDRVTLCHWSSGPWLKCNDSDGDGYTTAACGNLVLYSSGGCQHAVGNRQYLFNRHAPQALSRVRCPTRDGTIHSFSYWHELLQTV